jgi:S-DNA-T family DNA segregation ATPase FtsK/SpoIIIE
MASYNTHQREPLLDRQVQAALQKRGREALGLGLIVLAGMIAMMLWTYTPSDPGLFASSDQGVQNALGRTGATIAAPLMVIIGVASWGLVLFAAGWGLRLVTGRGHAQAMARGVFLPIALAVTALWAATLVPSAGWDTLHGMGGVFGDTVLGALVNALPMSPAAGVTLMGFALSVICLATWAFVMGVDWAETRQFLRFLGAGMALVVSGTGAVARGGLSGMGSAALSGLSGGIRGAQAARAAAAQHMQDRRARAQVAEPTRAGHGYAPPPAAPGYAPAHDAQGYAPAPAPARKAPPVIRASGYDMRQDTGYAQPARAPRAEPRLTHAPGPARTAPMPEPEPEPAPGLLARLKVLSSRPAPPPEPEPEPDLHPELIEPPLSAAARNVEPGGEARIRSRIADAIRHRKTRKPVMQFDRTRHPQAEPPLRAQAMPHPAPHPVTQPVAPAAEWHAPQPVRLQAEIPAPMPGAVPMPDWMQAAMPAAPAPQPRAPEMPAPSDYQPEDAAPEMPRSGHVLQRRVVTPHARKPQPSRQAQAEAEPRFAFDPQEPVFELPPLSLLENPANVTRHTLSDEALEENARMLENVLDDYGVRGEIVSVRPGPVVTQYELEPAPGLKASRVIGLADDIARSMSALSARVSTVPGRSIIGIELPNAHREKVVLREILAARDYGDSNMRLPLALGKGIDGEPIVANLAKMPHLLIAGTTGSGKSVAINTMILSLLYRLPPEECRMIMIDPKMLELSVYDGIPHLLSPVVTDPKKAVVALKWVVGEMEERYRKMSKMGVRNIEGYNGRVREALEKGEMFKRTIQTGFDDETGDPVFETEEFAPELLPFIVVVVDEMADLMMVAGKEIEACIQRLAQMARASGIHLIMATQRPSVDVITGTIKANFPTRISFQVTSKIDSRTILGEQGAEQLLGMGDMLYMAGGGRLNRIHGPFVSDEEVEEVVTHLKSFGPPDYKSGVVDGPEDGREADIDAVLGLGGNTGGEDALYDQAVQVVIQDRKCSTSYIQRKLGIGYNKAARLVEQMEDEGLVTAANHVGKREILVPEQG